METVGRVYGGQIFCLSPSRKDVVPITQNQGKTDMSHYKGIKYRLGWEKNTKNYQLSRLHMA